MFPLYEIPANISGRLTLAGESSLKIPYCLTRRNLADKRLSKVIVHD